LVTLGLLKQVQDIAPLDKAATHGALGFSLIALVALLTLFTQHQDQLLYALDQQAGGGDFQLDPLTTLAIATEFIGPAPPFVHDRLGKHDQVRQLVAEQLAHGKLQQLLARVAEQLAGRDVQVHEAVVIGVE